MVDSKFEETVFPELSVTVYPQFALKLVVTDIDGTIVEMNGKLQPEIISIFESMKDYSKERLDLLTENKETECNIIPTINYDEHKYIPKSERNRKLHWKILSTNFPKVVKKENKKCFPIDFLLNLEKEMKNKKKAKNESYQFFVTNTPSFTMQSKNIKDYVSYLRNDKQPFLHEMNYDSLSKKYRFIKETDEFNDIRGFMEFVPKKERQIAKEYLRNHGFFDSKNYTDDKIDNFINYCYNFKFKLFAKKIKFLKIFDLKIQL